MWQDKNNGRREKEALKCVARQGEEDYTCGTASNVNGEGGGPRVLRLNPQPGSRECFALSLRTTETADVGVQRGTSAQHEPSFSMSITGLERLLFVVSTMRANVTLSATRTAVKPP